MSDYPPPLDQLLTLGDRYDPGPGASRWPDYPKRFGLGPEHVPDLIRMATDAELNMTVVEGPALWAPLHARRALGQLRAVEAVGPLLEAMDRFGEDDDSWTDELHEVFATIGPPAIPALVEGLAQTDRYSYSRVACAMGLEEIAKAHPGTRDEVIGILGRQLACRKGEANSLATVNGFIVSALVALKAVGAVPAIEAAYGDGVVDETVQGDLSYVRYDLGLGPKPEHPRSDFGLSWPLVTTSGPRGPARRPDLKKLKQRRKAQNKARKQNCKRR